MMTPGRALVDALDDGQAELVDEQRPRPRRRGRLVAIGVVGGLLVAGAAANYHRPDYPCGPGGRPAAARIAEVLGPCVDTFRHGPACRPVSPRPDRKLTAFTLPSCDYPGK